ncbi:hypothetical protein ACFSUS_16400 [Spirosoma soli]|uniref:DUF5004 domain-containing protein n=1 Tax=Spirosoma soli TaxID=1770529 RepID=A0ABW5M5F6_9BACT
MKNYLFTLLITSLLFYQCTQSKEVAPNAPNIDYDQESIELMKTLAPQIVGQWKLRQVKIKYQNYNTSQKELKIAKDTTLLDIATLTIVPAAVPRSSPRDFRRGEYDGTIKYGNKTYPVQFDMLANADWIINRKGPQTFFLFSYRFPNGSHLTEPEEAFLQKIGLVGDNFSLETTSKQSTMIWRGLNRGIEQIELVKQ